MPVTTIEGHQIHVDDEGFIYVSAEWEKNRQRGVETGQFMKLDPSKPDDPEVWKVDLRDDGGIWATPAIAGDIIYTATDRGQIYAFDGPNARVIALNKSDGKYVAQYRLGGGARDWSDMRSM